MLSIRWIGFILAFLFPISMFCQGIASAKAASNEQTTVKQPAPFKNQLRNTIVFLHVHYAVENDPEDKEIDGTAFFMAVPDTRLPQGAMFLYLVTNRHMAAPDSHLGITRRVKRYDVLANTIQHIGDRTEVQERTFSLSSPWYFPEDKSIDLAVLPVSLNPESVSYQQVSVNDIATDEMRETARIAPGYQVVFAGFFYQFPGAKKIQPIVRQGVLAMTPDDLIPTVIEGRKGTVFLVDAHSYHGNSGSPVFVNLGGVHGSAFAPESYKLLGVVSGYYPEHEDGSLSAATVLTGTVHDNSGITIVVPGEQLRSLLNSAPLQTLREEKVQQFLKQKH